MSNSNQRVVVGNVPTTTNDNLERRIFRVSPIYYETIRGINFQELELGMLSFNNPPLCNYQCRKCLSGINDENRVVEGILSNEEVFNITKQAAQLGALYVEMSGTGEPFVTRAWTLNVIDSAYQNGLDSLIVTNGSLLSREILQFLAERNASLLISLDCMCREDYDRNIGREGYFDRVLDNIELAKSIYAPLIREENSHQIMKFGIHTILSEFNLDVVEQLNEFAGDDIYFSVAPLAEEAGNARNNADLNNNPRERIQELINNFSDTSVITCYSSIPQFGFPVCGSMLYGLGIDYNGDILVDAHFYETRNIIGNIRNLDMQNAINLRNYYVNLFYEMTGSRCFCPMRDQKNYQSFISNIGGNSSE